MNDRALAHEEFMRTLRHFRDNGATAVERDLARTALGLYELTSWHPPVIDFVNAETLKALESRDQ